MTRCSRLPRRTKAAATRAMPIMTGKSRSCAACHAMRPMPGQLHLLDDHRTAEQVFNWPGMGRMAWQAAQDRDFPGIMGIALLAAGRPDSKMVLVWQVVRDC